MIRNFDTLLESLVELAAQTKDVEQRTKLVRERLAAHNTSRLRAVDGAVTALTLDSRLGEVLRKSLRDIAAGVGGALDPEMLRGLVAGDCQRAPDDLARPTTETGLAWLAPKPTESVALA